jgi:hypothetical protein
MFYYFYLMIEKNLKVAKIFGLRNGIFVLGLMPKTKFSSLHSGTSSPRNLRKKFVLGTYTVSRPKNVFKSFNDTYKIENI